jgi:hypothetical protein
MPFQAVPNVAQCRIIGNMDAQLTINDLFFEISGGGITPTNLQQLANGVNGWAFGNLAPQLSDDWAYVRTDAIDLTSATGPVATSSDPATGGVSGESAPNNVAACVSLRTAQRGRSGRGRNYVPGIPNTVITLNLMDDAFVNNLLLEYNGLVGPGTLVAGWQLVVVSRVTGGVVRAVGLAIPVTQVIMTTKYVRSMRSREVGHGA